MLDFAQAHLRKRMGQFWQLVSTSKLLSVSDTSLTDYRKRHTFWFSFEKEAIPVNSKET